MIRLAGFEGTQLYGESLPLDAHRGTGFDKVGFTLRQPCGVVVAITPFNYPSLLVLHKLAPALAAGNAVVLKPASTTPLTALALARAFVDAGLPDGVLSVLTGPGGDLGDALVGDPRVRKISFTGSTARGGAHHPARRGEEAVPRARRLVPGRDPAGRRHRGGGRRGRCRRLHQRRPGVHLGAAGDLPPRDPRATSSTHSCPRSRPSRSGTPRKTAPGSGPSSLPVRPSASSRAVRSAVEGGARLLTGGERDGAQVSPAVVDGVDPSAPLNQEELFGPAVAVSTAENWTDAIAQANSTPYGLGAGVFTGDVAGAVRAMRQIDAGIVHVNWTPLWRADLMPYGGLKASGVGKEGFRTAVSEMTEEKTIVLHGRPW